ncbi:tubulin-dependent ATPase kip3 [Entomophthora muscae]|uniref:Tubulin-dependent ATPase kip3 n=1 Tax=Entomophthora muscae TaxID=34485 RepID=A0ACC2RD99_9FUNG|nr:tubulin-dependent ATPase kip3 [Entomophthora muscae]
MAAGKSSLSSIMVAVRVRPFSPEEQKALNESSSIHSSFSSTASFSKPLTSKKGTLKKIVYALDDHVIAFDPPEESISLTSNKGSLPRKPIGSVQHRDSRFAFDRVFNEEATQEDVFEGTSKDLIDEVLNGFNSTVFAYGATGCGKTHTMCGTPGHPGIIFLTMKDLYSRINSAEGQVKFSASVSYLEVYNETIKDLLSPEKDRKKTLELRENSKTGVTVAGLTEKFPQTIEEMMSIIMQGNSRRTVSATEANSTSSRSHAVLQINVRQSHGTPILSKEYTFATLSFIDLAGSERAATSSNQAVRVVEGVKINTSLLALGNCIEALAKNKPGDHIPYRGSKLTRLLKFSLGGNCKTVMIVCVSPASKHFDETYNTLKYADRAKKIKTKIARNTLNVNMHISQYPKQIEQLKDKVMQLEKQLMLEKERNAELADTSMNENHHNGKASILSGLRSRLRFYHDSFLSKKLECRKKVFLRTLYKNRISLLQGWLDSFSENTPSQSKQQFSTLPGLQKDLKDRTASLERDIEFANDTFKRNEPSFLNNIQSILQEARASFNLQACEILEQDCELFKNEFDASYNEFVIKAYQEAVALDVETLRHFIEGNATMLLGLKDFISLCKSKDLDVSYIDRVYLSAIKAFAFASKNIATISSTVSRPSTPSLAAPSTPVMPSKRPLSPQKFSPHHTTAKVPRSILCSSVKSSSKPKKTVKIDAVSPKASKKGENLPAKSREHIFSITKPLNPTSRLSTSSRVNRISNPSPSNPVPNYAKKLTLGPMKRGITASSRDATVGFSASKPASSLAKSGPVPFSRVSNLVSKGTSYNQSGKNSSNSKPTLKPSNMYGYKRSYTPLQPASKSSQDVLSKRPASPAAKSSNAITNRFSAAAKPRPKTPTSKWQR